MAKDGKLEIEIGADISQLNKGISDAEILIKKLSKEKQANLKLGLDVSAINPQISEAKAKLNELQNSLSKTSVATNYMAKSTGNGSNALMQFSRIAQDAPYGIIGIGNNITATAEAFGHLKNQTGSTGGALKAMASSLMGTGGILLGVSLLTTGFTLLAQSGLSVRDIINKITGDFDDFGASVKNAREEGLKSAGKEIESLRSLVSVAQNDNIAKKNRLVAVEKLQSQFPAYYGNLSKEHIMYGDLTKATHEATKALISKSVAEKLGDKAGDMFIKRMSAQQNFNDNKKKLDKFDEESAKRGIGNAKDLTRLEFAKLTAQEKVAQQLAATRKTERDDIENKTEEKRQILIKSLNDLQKYYDLIDKLNQISSPLNQSEQKATKSPPKTKAPKINPNAGNDFRAFLNPFESSVFEPIKLKFTDPTEAFLDFNAKTAYGLTETQKILYEFSESISELASTSIAGAFQSLGDNIGNALANGTNVLSAVGNGLIQSLGGFLSQLGDRLITYGLLLAGFGKAELAFKVGDPVTKIGAGVAMVALGIAAKGAGAVVSSVGSKGLQAGGSGSGANNSSRVTSGFISNSGANNGGTVVFEISGTSLIGVLNNTQARNLRIGGSN